MRKLVRFFPAAALIAAFSLTASRRPPAALRDAPVSFQDSAAELGEASRSFKNRGVSEVSSVQGVALEAAPPQSNSRKEVSQQLIPEVLSLKKGQLFPRSLFDKYSTNAIAESLVERLYRIEMNQKAPSSVGDMVDMWAETELHRYAYSKNFLMFVKAGIKNQFQTKTTSGYLDFSGRNRVEERLMGIKLIEARDGAGSHAEDIYSDKQVNNLRPKYGVLFFPNQESDANTPCTGAYGDFILIFNDRLKLRSTWTRGDSLLQSFNLGRTFWERLPKSAVLDNNVGAYFEFQTFGDIGIEDVSEIGVMKSEYDFEKTPVKFQGALIDAGFKVVEFQTCKFNSRKISYRKNRTLSKGNPDKLARWIARVRAGGRSPILPTRRAAS